MNEKVGDIYNWILFRFTYRYFYYGTIFLYDHSMDCKRKCNPLVFLDTTVIMGIQISQIRIFIQRILFHIKSWGVNMCSQNVHTFLNRLLTYMKKCHDLFHSYSINFISGLDLFAGFQFLFQGNITLTLRFLYQFFYTLTFSLGYIQKISVILCQFFQIFFIGFCIGKPCILSLHVYHLMLHSLWAFDPDILFFNVSIIRQTFPNIYNPCHS